MRGPAHRAMHHHAGPIIRLDHQAASQGASVLILIVLNVLKIGRSLGRIFELLYFTLLSHETQVPYFDTILYIPMDHKSKQTMLSLGGQLVLHR